MLHCRSCELQGYYTYRRDSYHLRSCLHKLLFQRGLHRQHKLSCAVRQHQMSKHRKRDRVLNLFQHHILYMLQELYMLHCRSCELQGYYTYRRDSYHLRSCLHKLLFQRGLHRQHKLSCAVRQHQMSKHRKHDRVLCLLQRRKLNMSLLLCSLQLSMYDRVHQLRHLYMYHHILYKCMLCNRLLYMWDQLQLIRSHAQELLQVLHYILYKSELLYMLLPHREYDPSEEQ